MPREIVREKRSAAETKLNADYGRPFVSMTGDLAGAHNETLYQWAEEAIAFLSAVGDECPKLTLAKLIDLISDPRWLAGATVQVTKLTARHRVIARFAREGRWRALWTFNWDCHIEAALKAVGIDEEPLDSNQPWVVRYQRFLGIEDYGHAPDQRTIQVHKPHGCVRSLIDADEAIKLGKRTAGDFTNLSFKITKTELESAPPAPAPEFAAFQTRLQDHFRANPNVSLGWSASERYLLDELDAIKDYLREYPDPETRLSVVDPEFNGNGHSRLASIYGVTQAQSHFPVEVPGNPTVDTLMRWVQARYTLEMISKFVPQGQVRNQIDHWASNLGAGQTPQWLLDWADFLVPSWVRLCWREGLVEARSYAGNPLLPEQVRLEGDWHVPLAQPIPQRPELVAVGCIFHALSQHPSTWMYDDIPGFVTTATGQAIVPVPVWGEVGKRRWLSSLSPLVKSLRDKRAIYPELCVLPVAGDRNPTDKERDDAYVAVQTFSAPLGWSTGRNLRLVTMDQVYGGAV